MDEHARSLAAETGATREDEMELLLPVGLIVGWFALQWWVLPRLGVPT